MKYYRKDIPTFEGKYAADTNGEIWYYRKGELIKMSQYIDKGYYYVTLMVNKIQKNFRVSRLIAQTFIGEIPDGYVIDHIDTNPLNNNVDNLRICTQKENNNNPLTYAKRCKRVREVCNKSVILRGVKDGSVYHFESMVEVSRFFGYKNKNQLAKNMHISRREGLKTVRLRKEDYYFQVSNR